MTVVNRVGALGGGNRDTMSREIQGGCVTIQGPGCRQNQLIVLIRGFQPGNAVSGAAAAPLDINDSPADHKPGSLAIG